MNLPKFIGFSLFLSVCFESYGESLPRSVIALYPGNSNILEENAPLIRHLELPLNHKGFFLNYHNYKANPNLPADTAPKNTAGVISWFTGKHNVNPKDYLDWALNHIQAGHKYLVIDNLGYENSTTNTPPSYMLHSFLKYFGLQKNGWQKIFKTEFHSKYPSFENKNIPFTLSIPRYKIIDPHLTLWFYGKKDNEVIPFTTLNKNYGYTLSQHFFQLGNTPENNRWIVNPFFYMHDLFLAKPKPIADTTTLNGHRIFYGHIDGDGFMNVADKEVDAQSKIAGQVILEQVLQKNPDLPMTIGFIVAELNPLWWGTKKTREVAKLYVHENYLEIGCHGFTHPLNWSFFENEEKAYNEEQLKFNLNEKKIFHELSNKEKLLTQGYDAPRSYIYQKFTLDLEIKDAVRYLNVFFAPHKSVKLYQWSGDCMPFAKALKVVNDLNLPNINGGDTQYDDEVPTYIGVAPLGRSTGGYRQIYASNSNENTYTHDWAWPYTGFKNLTKTFMHTEKPWRLKPLNLYYHFFSGEKKASLQALQQNILFIKQQEFIPITASHYATLAQDFYKVNFDEIAPLTWKVQNRGKLNTIRFDEATFLSCDFEKSKGVIGQKHYQGSLYVSLDPSSLEPLICIQEHESPVFYPASSIPYLIESRWLVENVKYAPHKLKFQTQGFGDFRMLWQLPSSKAHIKIFEKDTLVHQESKEQSSKLTLDFPLKPMLSYKIEVEHS
jgi:polysaccharide biosynthesis protein PelA